MRRRRQSSDQPGNRGRQSALKRDCHRARLTVAALLWWAGCAFGAPGVVQTRDARFAGEIIIQTAAVQVGSNTVPWDSVLYVLFNPELRTFPPPQRVQWRNGEEWLGRLAALSAGKLTFLFELFGAREVARTNLSLLDFSPRDVRQGENAPGTLYLRDSDPLPGTLVWMDARQVALDSPLGVLTIPRERVVRYAFPADDRPPIGPGRRDEVRLVDGTIFKGVIQFGNDQLTLRQPSLGELLIPAAVVRSISRSSNTVRLAELLPEAVETTGLFSETPREGRVIFERHDDPQTIRSEGLTSLQIPAKTTLRYRINDELASATFRARLGPLPDARGSATIVLLAGTTALLKKEINPADLSVPVSVAVPAAGELVIQVDFGSRIGFPCGVKLGDAVFLSDPDRRSK